MVGMKSRPRDAGRQLFKVTEWGLAPEAALKDQGKPARVATAAPDDGDGRKVDLGKEN